MQLLLMARLWRLLLPENRVLAPYVECAIMVGDSDALRAIAIVMREERWKKILEEYRHRVRIWTVAEDMLAEGGDYANEDTAERQVAAYRLLKRMDDWVLGKGPNPFNR